MISVEITPEVLEVYWKNMPSPYDQDAESTDAALEHLIAIVVAFGFERVMMGNMDPRPVPIADLDSGWEVPTQGETP